MFKNFTLLIMEEIVKKVVLLIFILTVTNLDAETSKAKPKQTDCNCELDVLAAECPEPKETYFTAKQGRWGIEPSMSFIGGHNATSFLFSLSSEIMITDGASWLTSFSVSYDKANSTSITSAAFAGGFRLYFLDDARVLPYIQIAGGLIYASASNTSRTGGLLLPGIGLVFPINNYITVNWNVGPRIIFSGGMTTYIYTEVGLGFWL